MNVFKRLLLSLPAFLLGTSSILAQSSQEETIPAARPLANTYITGSVTLVLVGVVLFLGFLSSRRGHRD